MLTIQEGNIFAYSQVYSSDQCGAVTYAFIKKPTYTPEIHVNDWIEETAGIHNENNCRHYKVEGNFCFKSDNFSRESHIWGSYSYRKQGDAYVLKDSRNIAYYAMVLIDYDKDGDYSIPDCYHGHQANYNTYRVFRNTVLHWNASTKKLTGTSDYDDYWYEGSSLKNTATGVKYTFGTYNRFSSIGTVRSVRPEGFFVAWNDIWCLHDGPRMLLEPHKGSWNKGDLCQICCDDAQVLDLNTTMYIKELFELKEMVMGTASLFTGHPNVKTLKGLKDIVKRISSAYLSATYGYKLTIKDTIELYNNSLAEFRKVKKEWWTAHARLHEDVKIAYDVPAKYTGTASMTYKALPYELAQFCHECFKWDVFPSLGNLYDFIPWSFVVDWFFPIGDALDAIDTRTFLSTCAIRHVTYGEKWEFTPPAEKVSHFLPWFGSLLTPLSQVNFSFYHRWVEKNATPPDIASEFPHQFNHWVESAALIFQKI